MDIVIARDKVGDLCFGAGSPVCIVGFFVHHFRCHAGDLAVVVPGTGAGHASGSGGSSLPCERKRLRIRIGSVRAISLFHYIIDVIFIQASEINRGVSNIIPSAAVSTSADFVFHAVRHTVQRTRGVAGGGKRGARCRFSFGRSLSWSSLLDSVTIKSLLSEVK